MPDFDEIQQSRLQQGHAIAARLQRNEGFDRWAVIYPYKIDSRTGMGTIRNIPEPWQFRFVVYGVPEWFDDEKYDLHDEYLHFEAEHVCNSIEQLTEVIEQTLPSDCVFSIATEIDCPTT